jgi:hypothetical protein
VVPVARPRTPLIIGVYPPTMEHHPIGEVMNKNLGRGEVVSYW